MKSQSLKLFATAFVLGLMAIFGAVSASAQTTLRFETQFDFHVGKDKLAAGNYELQKLEAGKYLLRSAETKEARIVVFDISAKAAAMEKVERVVFNRYGETYFLSSVFDKRDADGRQIIETSYEKRVRKGTADRENQLAGEKAKPEKVSVNLSK